MAEDLDDGEFWLPPQFLTDDEFHVDYNGGDKINSGNRYEFSRESYGFGSSGSFSDLSSPVESVVGSTETEIDEDDFITGLTQKMTHSTLQDDFITGLTQKMAHSTLQDDLWKADSGLGYENQKSWAMAGSPQSTLCTVLDGYGCKQGSSRGSPNCPSPVSPPPPPAAAVLRRSEAGLDLLHAAAGEVARMKMIEEGIGYYENRGLFVPTRKPSPVSLPLKNPNASTNVGFNFNSNQPLHYQQFQIAQFQQLKQQQTKKQSSAIWGPSEMNGQYQLELNQQMAQNRARTVNRRSQNLSQTAWPSLQQSQQQTGSGMRAVFLGNHGPKRECAGTGVFLPRRIGNPTETRKKPACSVLLPDRVVQALNLNLDAMDGAQPHLQPRYNGSFTADHDVAIKYRNNVLAAQRSQNVQPQPVPQPVMKNEVRLPQEWTY